MNDSIFAAAIKRPSNGMVFSLPRPARHNDVIAHIVATNPDIKRVGAGYEQGFVTVLGRFVGREEALIIARAAGQIKEKHRPLDELLSEDIW